MGHDWCGVTEYPFGEAAETMVTRSKDVKVIASRVSMVSENILGE